MAEIAGLTLITPSSVGGTGTSLSGAKVVFTSAGTVNVNGVFDSTYDNYLVVLRYEANAGNSTALRLRASGSDASGTDYTRQRVTADNTSISGIRNTGQSSVTVAINDASSINGLHMHFYGPYLSQASAGRNVAALSRSTVTIMDTAWTHSLTTAYDGFTILGSAQTITGSLTVYGLSQ